MKHKSKALGIFALVCFLTYLYGCQKEEFEIDIKQVNKKHIKIPYFQAEPVDGEAKDKVTAKLFGVLGIQMRNTIEQNQQYSTEYGTIKTDEVLRVYDSLGYSNYTFKLEHSETTNLIFFNIVMHERELGTVVKLVKYEMTQQFETQYRSGLKQLGEFEGTTTTYTLSNPCMCEFPNETIPVNTYPVDFVPSPDGGGEATGTSGGPAGSPSGGSSTGGDQSGPTCEVLILNFYDYVYIDGTEHLKNIVLRINTCTGEFSYSYPNYNRLRKNTLNQTETYNENDCCNEGVVGILDASSVSKKNCTELKSNLENTDFLTTLNDLKIAANGTVEKGGLIWGNTSNSNITIGEIYEADETNPHQINFGSLSSNNPCAGLIHCHLNSIGDENLAIFSPDDMIGFKNIIVTSTLQPHKFVMYVTSNRGTFAIKISDKQKFINKMNSLELALSLGVDDNYNEKIKHSDPVHVQIKNFLQYYGNENNSGFELYKLNETPQSTDFNKWQKAILVGNNITNQQVDLSNTCK
jgi:hypothetical protein